MAFKHTRRTTSRTERHPDGREVIEESEEELLESDDPSRFDLTSPRPTRRQLWPPNWRKALTWLSIGSMVARMAAVFQGDGGPW